MTIASYQALMADEQHESIEPDGLTDEQIANLLTENEERLNRLREEIANDLRKGGRHKGWQ